MRAEKNPDEFSLSRRGNVRFDISRRVDIPPCQRPSTSENQIKTGKQRETAGILEP